MFFHMFAEHAQLTHIPQQRAVCAGNQIEQVENIQARYKGLLVF